MTAIKKWAPQWLSWWEIRAQVAGFVKDFRVIFGRDEMAKVFSGLVRDGVARLAHGIPRPELKDRMVDDKILAAKSFLTGLRENDLLPGWSKGDEGTIYCEPYPDSVTFDGRKRGDAAIYHYKVEQPNNTGDWKLQKAWRTDQNSWRRS